MSHRGRAVFLLCVFVLLAGGVASSYSGRTEQGPLGASTGSTQASRTLPPLGQRRSRQRIVFEDEFAGKGAVQGFGGIDSIRLDGRGLRRLATGTSDPAVSLDRTKISYQDDDVPGGIKVIRADGTHGRWIDREGDAILDGQPAWSPNGRKLVFIRTISPAPSGALFQSALYTINADGSGRRRLARAAFDFPGPSWINARQILITAARGRLAIISAQTGRVQRWIDVPTRGTQAAPDPPALAPNRREIAYVECDNGDCSFASVDLITLHGQLLRRIRGAHTPAWTPQGDLLYACCGQAGIRGQISQIFLAPARGGPARAITPRSISADQPQWLGLVQTRRSG